MILNTTSDFRGNHIRRAFTLIELLVVVAIIVILVAILLPSLGRARDQAKQVSCLSNIRQVSMALQMYLDENAGRFPYRVMCWWNPDGGTYGWMNGMQLGSWPRRLNPYLGDNTDGSKALYCPGDEAFAQRPAKMSDNYDFSVSYLWRYGLGYAAEDASGGFKRALVRNDFAVPGSQAVMFERKEFHGEFKRNIYMVANRGAGYILLNAAYADGHAEPWKMTVYSTGGVFDPGWFINNKGTTEGLWNPQIGND